MHPIPTHARVVIVGGGIAGCSTAYHLTKLGVRDVVLLEQGRLTCGTTWHAAGLVGQTRATRNATRMSRYGIELYATLEQETGLATGWTQCGSLNVAATPERLQADEAADGAREELRHRVRVRVARGGRPDRADPAHRRSDRRGVDSRRRQGESDRSHDVARQRRAQRRRDDRRRRRGHRRRRSTTATSPACNGGAATRAGRSHCEAIVNCAGQWSRAFGRRAGVNVPLYSAEHFYLVTGKIDGVTPKLPVIRDPDGFIYYKEEVGGLVMGGFEPVAKPWNLDPIPPRFEFQLLDEDWEQFEPLMRNAIHRTPCLESAPVKMLLNGPESFTLDGNFILGEAPELAGFFVCAGFNSAGIANAGGAGKLIAQWVVDGEAPVDLWDVDVRRFAPFHANRLHLQDRTVETLGLHYAMRWPREELASVRPLRRSPLYDRLKAKGAVFGTKLNWERANYFLPPGVAEPPLHARHARVAAARAGGAARVPRGCRRLRPDVVREIRAEGPRCAGRAATAVRERDGRRRPDASSTPRC